MITTTLKTDRTRKKIYAYLKRRSMQRAMRELLIKEGLLPRMKRGRKAKYDTDEERLEALRRHRKEARLRYEERMKNALQKLTQQRSQELLDSAVQ